jgi:hypothetical protein
MAIGEPDVEPVSAAAGVSSGDAGGSGPLVMTFLPVVRSMLRTECWEHYQFESARRRLSGDEQLL